MISLGDAEWSLAGSGWIPKGAADPHEESSIDQAEPVCRSAGGVLGAARHGARRYVTEGPSPSFVDVPDLGRCSVLSMWVLCYQPGDFAALHTDRPDSTFTALQVLGGRPDPLLICPDLAALTDQDLCATARRDPFPVGRSLALPTDGCLIMSGANVPHYRPPATSRFEVLSVSLGPLGA
ncbi:MAG TPA: hypothetical protein VEW93_01790 [Acidimicrobiales bacterium]|nr:hypothetical protein [Acidimicrobiales bacterium]